MESISEVLELIKRNSGTINNDSVANLVMYVSKRRSFAYKTLGLMFKKMPFRLQEDTILNNHLFHICYLWD